MIHLDSIPRRSWTDSAIRASDVFAKHNEHQRDDERTQKPEYQKVKQLWEEMTDIPEHGRAKVIADREDIKASYDTVRRWCPRLEAQMTVQRIAGTTKSAMQFR